MPLIISLLLITGSVRITVPSAHAAAPSVVGTWELVSMEKQEADGAWVPRCHSPTGLITYTAQGYMAVGINCMKDAGSKEPSTEMKDTIFYTGRYKFADGVVTHQVENSSDPIFYGKELMREVKFQKDGTILLSGKGKAAPVRLVWKRRTS